MEQPETIVLGKCFVCEKEIRTVPQTMNNADDAVDMSLEGFYGSTTMDGQKRRGWVCDECVRTRQHLLDPKIEKSWEAEHYNWPIPGVEDTPENLAKRQALYAEMAERLRNQ